MGIRNNNQIRILPNKSKKADIITMVEKEDLQWIKDYREYVAKNNIKFQEKKIDDLYTVLSNNPRFQKIFDKKMKWNLEKNFAEGRISSINIKNFFTNWQWFRESFSVKNKRVEFLGGGVLTGTGQRDEQYRVDKNYIISLDMINDEFIEVMAYRVSDDTEDGVEQWGSYKVERDGNVKISLEKGDNIEHYRRLTEILYWSSVYDTELFQRFFK